VRARETALVAGVLVLTLACYQLLFGGFFPSPGGTVGHDYSYFLPQLLTGFFWFEQNGPLEVPWFNPALGGGIPFYPNPACGYYSLPQALAFVVDPLSAVRITLILFAAAGYAGTYLLLRRVLAVGVWPALLGAVAFTFNGYFSHRMLVGHFAFHSYMLLPWIAYVTTRPLPDSRRAWRILYDSVLVGLGYAYTFQSGNFYGVPAVVLVTFVVGLVLVSRGPGGWSFVPRLALGGCAALLLCCSKLGAAASFLASFPRTGYPLPGASSVSSALGLVAHSLFWYAPADAGSEVFVNHEVEIGVQEFEYGVSPVPAVLMALFVLWRLVSRRWPVVSRRRAAAGTAIAVLLLVPIAVNVYEPEWNAFIKSVPVLGSSSIMIRHFAALTAVAVLFGALALEALPARSRAPLALAGIVGIVAFNSLEGREFYRQQPYDPAPVVASWREVHASGSPPPITRIVAPVDAEGRPIPAPIDRNDALSRGGSQLVCYEPIFGYFQEWFPFARMQVWLPLDRLQGGVPAETRVPGGWSFNEPSYFLFGAETGEVPGDPFPVERLEDLRAFLDWRPFPFEKPARQVWLDRLNLATLLGVGLFLAACPLLRRRPG